MIEKVDNERWKTDGDCRYCRKKLYCGKDCKAAVKRFESIAMEMVNERTGKRKIEEALNGSL